jgi:hypothetical protein
VLWPDLLWRWDWFLGGRSRMINHDNLRWIGLPREAFSGDGFKDTDYAPYGLHLRTDRRGHGRVCGRTSCRCSRRLHESIMTSSAATAETTFDRRT